MGRESRASLVCVLDLFFSDPLFNTKFCNPSLSCCRTTNDLAYSQEGPSQMHGCGATTQEITIKKKNLGVTKL